MGKGEKLASPTATRRTFVKGAGLTALAAAVGTTAFGEGIQAAEADESQPQEKLIWNTCSGCGVGKCPLLFHVVDGTITYVEGDNTGGNEFGENQCRACLRGRSIRKWINSPDRLKRPLRRVEGTKRGEGKFEEISWDEAIDLFYEKLKHVIDTYGNEAVFRNSADGSSNGGGGGLFGRLMNMNGGFLQSYGTDSQSQADFGAGFMLYGDYQFASSYDGTPSPAMREADLVLLFGSSAATSRNNGGGSMYDISIARENGARIVNVDVRQGEEESGNPDEWLPIRPGTDGALASAICYVLIDEGLAKEDLLHQYCSGYDDETMPEALKGQGKSYKDYIMGTGYDMVAKTPEWAAPITQIPAKKIYDLAHDIANAKTAYIGAGVGVQRRSNGENACRAIMMIPLLSGQFGLPGTSLGLKCATSQAGPWIGGYQAGENPLPVMIPVTKRIEVVERGHEFTALRDGLRGGDKLTQDVKFIYARGTNMLVNQNSDVNWAASVLEDESKCEFIVGSDFFLTSSMKYCDLVLPECTEQEKRNYASTLYGGHMSFCWGEKVQEPPYECRREFEWLADLAERFGCRDEFTEGTDDEAKAAEGYEQAYQSGYYPGIPTLEEGQALGWWCKPVEIMPALAAFRQDPVANPLPTPSGKIEVYSPALQEISETWELDDPRDVISPIPVYNPGYESYEDATEQYPLMGSSWKSKIRYHSKFNQNPLLNQASRHQVWINPIDAEPRGISTGDMVRIFNDRGEIRIEARVTPRIIPGAFALEEGKMRDLDENGVDVGGCVNTLTTHHWSPLAKHNSSNSILAQIEKVQG